VFGKNQVCEIRRKRNFSGTEAGLALSYKGKSMKIKLLKPFVELLSVIMAAMFLVIFSSSIAFSKPDGTLDSSFGQNGIVISPTGNGWNIIRAIAIQPDGKILAGGYAFTVANSNNSDFALARFNADGSVDTSFGVNGKVITPIRAFSDEIYALEVLRDGKIIAAGLSNRGASGQYDPWDIALARYNPNGSLDTSFGTNGITIAGTGNLWTSAKAIAIQKNGKIVTAGNGSVSRFNSNGTLDASFGNSGIVLLNNSLANSVVIQGWDKIVVAGRGGATFDDFALSRFNSNGSPDLSFGNNGRVLTSFGGNSEVYSLAVQIDGKIIAAGGTSTTNTDYDFALARYNFNGSPDNTFGNGGKVVTVFGNKRDIASSVSVQWNGKIIVAGSSVYNGSSSAFALAEYNRSGSLNYRFGNGGKVITIIGLGSEATAVALKRNGKIVVGGYSFLSPNNNFTLAQYRNS